MGLGPISSIDVLQAQAMKAKIVAFNVRSPASDIAARARREGVDVASDRVIYRLLTQVAGWMADLLPKVEEEEVVGQATVMQVRPCIFPPCRVSAPARFMSQADFLLHHRPSASLIVEMAQLKAEEDTLGMVHQHTVVQLS